MHVGIVSFLFGVKPEGICTERLVRALLEADVRVTLQTSPKARINLGNHYFKALEYSVFPREPRSVFKLVARARGHISNNYHFWSRRVSNELFPDGLLPDVFYARAWPHVSLAPAYYLARRHRKPLALHFSDPMPPPDNPVVPDHFKRQLRTMMEFAEVITFPCTQSLEYQKQLFDLPDSKLHVLPHVSIAPKVLPEVDGKRNYYYIGTARSHYYQADALVEGFAKHAEKFRDAKLTFVGSDKRYIESLIDRFSLHGAVTVLPPSRDVWQHMSRASALIAAEPEHNACVASTKILEYMHVNRPLMTLSPAGSATTECLKGETASAVVTSDYSPNEISRNFERVDSLRPTASDYEQRFESGRPFRSENVARKFIDIFNLIA